MKIALVSPYDFYWPGGVTAHISHLASNFRLLGHDVKILAPANEQNETKEDLDLIRLGRPVPVPTRIVFQYFPNRPRLRQRSGVRRIVPSGCWQNR